MERTLGQLREDDGGHEAAVEEGSSLVADGVLGFRVLGPSSQAGGGWSPGGVEEFRLPCAN